MLTLLGARARQRPGAASDILVDAAVGYQAGGSGSLTLAATPGVVYDVGIYDAGIYGGGTYEAAGKLAAASAGTLRPSLSFSSSSQPQTSLGAGTLALTVVPATGGAVYDDGTYAPGTLAAGNLKTGLAATPLALAPALARSGIRKVATAQAAAAGTLGYSRLGTRKVATAGSIAAGAPAPASSGLKAVASSGGPVALTATLTAAGASPPHTGVGTLALPVTVASLPDGAFDPGTFVPGTFADGGGLAAAGSASLPLTGTFARAALPLRSGAGGSAGATPTLTAAGFRPSGSTATLALAATVAGSAGRKLAAAGVSLALAPTLADPAGGPPVFDGTVFAGGVFGPDEAGKIVAGAGGTIANSLHFDPDGTSLNALSLLVFPAAVGRRTATAGGTAPITVSLTRLGLAKNAGTGAAPTALSLARVGTAAASGAGTAAATAAPTAAGIRTATPPGAALAAGTAALAADGSAALAGEGGLPLVATPRPASKGFVPLVLGAAAAGAPAIAGDGGDLRVGDLSMNTAGRASTPPGRGAVAITVDLAALGLSERAGVAAADLGATLAASGRPAGNVDIPPGIPLRGALRRAVALRGRLPAPVSLTGVLPHRPS